MLPLSDIKMVNDVMSAYDSYRPLHVQKGAKEESYHCWTTKKVRKDAKIDYCNLERLVMKVNPFPLSPGIMDCFAICQFLKFSSMSPSFCVKSATRHVAVKGLMFPL